MANDFSFQPLVDALVSKLAASGHYESVNERGPSSPPTGEGIAAAVWLGVVKPMPRASGLNVSTFLVPFNVTIYAPVSVLLPDVVDKRAMTAASALFASLWGDFDLSGPTGTAVADIDSVDLHGRGGRPPDITPGWLETESGYLRTLNVYVPTIINDVFTQVR